MCTSEFCVYYLVVLIPFWKECFIFMKKYLAFMVAVMLLVTAGAVFAADSGATSGHSGNVTPPPEDNPPETPVVVPVDITPANPNGGEEIEVVENPSQGETPTPGTSTGSEAAKTVEAAAAVGTDTKVITITEKKEETVQVTTYTAEAKAVAEEKIEKKVTKEEIKQSTADATKKVEVKASEAQVTELLTAAQPAPGGEQQEEGAVDSKAFADALVEATTTEADAENKDTSAADSTAAMAKALLNGQGNTSDTGNVNNPTLTQLKREGESIVQTIIRVIAEVAAKVEERTTAKANQLAERIAGTSSTGITITVKATASIKNVVTTRTVTKEDGTTEEQRSDEAMSTTDALTALLTQAKQNQTDATAGSAADTAAQETVRALSTQMPVQVSPPMEVDEPGIYPQNTTHKKDMYGKPIHHHVIRQDNRTARNRADGAFFVSAIENDGDAVFLNSAGEEITVVPGENEWTTDEDGAPLLIIPGNVTTMMYMEPGVVYTPIVTTTAEALETVEGITTTSEDATVEVLETREETGVEVPVYDVNEYSTSFDRELEAHFTESGYNTAIGLFIVSGDDGVWSASSAADNSMLTKFSMAVVRTLPKIRIAGALAGDTGKYVLGVRYDIPKNTDTQKVSGDNLLSFYPKGLTKTEGGRTVTQATGEALFLNNDGDPLTDAMVMKIANGEEGEELEEGVMSYNGYVVMTLAKDESEDYKPLITVQTTQFRPASEPDNNGGDNQGNNGGDNQGNTGGDNQGNTGGDNQGNTGGDTNNAPDNDPGSSSGGCSAGFSALALAVLGGFIAARKK